MQSVSISPVDDSDACKSLRTSDLNIFDKWEIEFKCKMKLN